MGIDATRCSTPVVNASIAYSGSARPAWSRSAHERRVAVQRDVEPRAGLAPDVDYNAHIHATSSTPLLALQTRHVCHVSNVSNVSNDMTRRISLDVTDPPGPALPGVGDLVAGKYRIERQLGRGGMGAVFEVTHTVTRRRFAIKWLLSAGAEGSDAVKRFVREAQIAGRIQHPHVVDVYDIYQGEPGFFTVMELLEGESLASRLSREGSLSAREACNIMLPCAAGVAAAHAVGVVHRDLKPGNIFLCTTRGSETVHPKVLDFGISRLMAAPDPLDTTETRTGSVIGTPYYMAPEQLRAEPSDQRVDVYALGVTLYELLSGKHPFEAASYPDLAVKIVSGRAAALDMLVPELPAGLVDVVARAMHHDRDRRFASVEAFIEALSPFAGDAQAASHTATRRGVSAISLAVGVGLLIAIASAAIGLYSSGRNRPQRAAEPTTPAQHRAADSSPSTAGQAQSVGHDALNGAESTPVRQRFVDAVSGVQSAQTSPTATAGSVPSAAAPRKGRLGGLAGRARRPPAATSKPATIEPTPAPAPERPRSGAIGADEAARQPHPKPRLKLDAL